jgi:anti-sigma-K factor RskA
MNYRDPELRKRLADAYVLGSLHGAARARFERLMRDDASLRMLVDKSSAQWNQLTEVVPPVAPPAHVWNDIQNRIQPQPNKQSEEKLSFLQSRIGFWKAWAIASTVTAIFLGMNMMQLKPAQIDASANFFALITDDAQSRASWVIGADKDANTMSVKALSPQPLADDRVFQLWVKVKNENKVRSVGLISPAGETNLALDKSISAVLDSIEKFGVSVEPLGGSPTGQPTTTPLYHGKILRI